MEEPDRTRLAQPVRLRQRCLGGDRLRWLAFERTKGRELRADIRPQSRGWILNGFPLDRQNRGTKRCREVQLDRLARHDLGVIDSCFDRQADAVLYDSVELPLLLGDDPIGWQ